MPCSLFNKQFHYMMMIVLQAMKCFVVAALLIGFVPLLLGLLFELVIVAPLRVPLDQSPIFFPWQVGLVL